MKRAIFIATSAVLLLLSTTHDTALAEGQDRGNGGDVIVCPSKRGKSVIFYDRYETEHRFGFKFVPPAGKDVNEKLSSLIQRLEKRSPTRAARYRKWASTLPFESKFLKGIELIDISDTGSGFIPAGCKPEQLVVQSQPKFRNDKRYTFNDDLWRLLDDDNKAVALMHELILREATSNENRHLNSQAARYLNAMVLSDQIASMNLNQWLTLLSEVEFQQADANGFSLALHDFTDGGELRRCPINYSGPDRIESASLAAPYSVTIAGQVHKGSCGLPTSCGRQWVRLSETGVPSELRVKSCSPIYYEFSEDSVSGFVYADDFRFSNDGRLSWAGFTSLPLPPREPWVAHLSGADFDLWALPYQFNDSSTDAGEIRLWPSPRSMPRPALLTSTDCSRSWIRVNGAKVSTAGHVDFDDAGKPLSGTQCSR